MTTIVTPPICLSCKHYADKGRTCGAYPTKLIPVEIWTSQEGHSELRGDEEVPVVFEPSED